MESCAPCAEDSGGWPRVPEVADTSLFLLNESLLPERTGVTTPLSRLLETREPLRDNDYFQFINAIARHFIKDNSDIVTVKDNIVIKIDCIVLSII